MTQVTAWCDALLAGPPAVAYARSRLTDRVRVGILGVAAGVRLQVIDSSGRGRQLWVPACGTSITTLARAGSGRCGKRRQRVTSTLYGDMMWR